MISALIVPLILAASSTSAPLAVHCDVAHLAACRDTNVLTRSSGTTSAMTKFLGKHAADRVGYLYAGRLIDQISEALGGPPDERRDLPGGGYLFTACRPHSCLEKGAVAFDASGHMTALAIVSFHCGGRHQPCSSGATLDLFVRDDDGSTRAAEAAITTWATAATAADASALNGHPFKGVVVHRLTTVRETDGSRKAAT